MNLNQITIPSKDVNSALPFYLKLGLKLIVNNLPDYVRFECPDGTSTFSIHHVENLPAGEGIIVYFECEDLDRTVAKLMKDGIQFESEPEDKPWLWREAYFRDFDGNKICLYYAGQNRLNPPWRV